MPAHFTATIADVRGAIRICTNRARDNEPVAGELRLAPNEAAVVELELDH